MRNESLSGEELLQYFYANLLKVFKLAITIFTVAVLPLLSQSTSEMLSSCKAVSEATIKEGSIQFTENFDTGTCWGAFGALHIVSGLYGTRRRPLLPMGCAPESSTRSQFIAIFVEYSRKNPQRLHENFAIVAIDALRESFPCRISK